MGIVVESLDAVIPASWRDHANHALLGVEGALESIAAARRRGASRLTG